ncbi:MAG: EAL domain-containing protein [Marinobacterium sp.]|nr:EAL domain-containing protein [Marinobacterium sp.]
MVADLDLIHRFNCEIAPRNGRDFMQQLHKFLTELCQAGLMLAGEPHRSSSTSLRVRYCKRGNHSQPRFNLDLQHPQLETACQLPAGQILVTPAQGLPAPLQLNTISTLIATPLVITPEGKPGLLLLLTPETITPQLQQRLENILPTVASRLACELHRQHLEHSIDDQQQQATALLDCLPSAFVLKDGENNWIRINQAASKLWDIPQLEFNHTPESLVAARYPHTAELLQQCHFSDEIAWRSNRLSVSTEYHQSDSRLHTFEVLKQPLFTPQGRRHRLMVLANDVSTQLDTQNELRLSASVFENSSQGILITDNMGRIERINNSAERILGADEAQLHNRAATSLLSRRQSSDAISQITPALNHSGEWQGELWMRHSDGNEFPVWMSISSVRDSQGNSQHFIGQFHDTSEEKSTEDYLYRLSHFDTLTGLPNRTSLQLHLEQLIEQQQIFAVLHLDINRLKLVNDSLGHHVGDLLLKQVSAMLTNTARHANYIAHLTGDEFMIVLTPSEIFGEGLAALVQDTLGHIMDRFYAPFHIGPHSINTSASVGIAQFPENGSQPERLLRAADTAVSHAKYNNQRFTYYDASMNIQLLRRLKLEHQLAGALEREEFELYYQPQYDTLNNKVIGCEALIRWHSPELGMVSPADFIPLAEETGLIVPIGAWVLRQACQDMADLIGSGFRLEHMAVNLSAAQFLSADLVHTVSDQLELSGLEPARLQLEITESIIIEDLHNTLKTLQQLRDLGTTLALDDFGTGYSSLSYLKQLPIDKLKIDRSFIEHIESDSADAAIARAIIDMAEALQLEVIAEGVESAGQIDGLQKINCCEIQGFFFARPMPMEKLIDFLHDQGCNRYQRIPLTSL